MYMFPGINFLSSIPCFSGLGAAESKLCAAETVRRGVKSGKRLAASINMGYFTLQVSSTIFSCLLLLHNMPCSVHYLIFCGSSCCTKDLMEAACPDPSVSALDELDYDLVNIAVNKLIQVRMSFSNMFSFFC